MTSRSRKFAVALVIALAAPSSARPAFLSDAGLASTASPRPASPAWIEQRVDDLGRAFDGKVGIAVSSIDDGWSAGWHADELYPQQSVSKLWVAITVLDSVDTHKIALDQSITLTRGDLTLFHQPIAEQILAGPFTTTLADLLVRAITTSDNTANDKLLWAVGGPDAVRSMIRTKHLGAIRFYNGERALQSRIAGLSWNPAYSVGNAFFDARDALPPEQRRAAFERYVADPFDGAAPSAMVAALARLKRGELLSPASTRYLLDTMSHTQTGPNRLKGGLQPGWTLNHKTGTGQVLGGAQAGYNDVGILTAPDGKAYAVAVMIKLTSAPLASRMTLMNDVVRAVITEHDMSAVGTRSATPPSSGSPRR